jgi:mannose-1-phosphate guanylyltransferase
LGQVDVAILAGGLGTRVRESLGARPKVLAPVGGRPFLHGMLNSLAARGVRRVVLCLGVGSDQVTEYLRGISIPGLEIVVSIEPRPLGTGGALRHALPCLRSDPVLVMNGDTICRADPTNLLRAHGARGAKVSLLCVPMRSTKRFGRVEVDDRGFVEGFVEKGRDGDQPGLVSAGVYVLSKSAIMDMPKRPCFSLERDYLEHLPPGDAAAHLEDSPFLDIGTPETLEIASRMSFDIFTEPTKYRSCIK